ncbi:MAG: aspartate-semialdehyde dehydrogenase [Deltaproteobacteria bacterium]|jgi:aspartate-semialdehyde dehydrogenase|nr:aspartate-semialdehyde dehydrogenase [Deltaproteobacteria bacterium]MBT4527873.1 aspartate-semialdehyde dehydrogenase [Deltaproteobacteria bacterium]
MSVIVAIAGATGAVGTELIKLLELRNFPVKDLRLLASKRSVGKKLIFAQKEIEIQELTEDAFEGIDIAFFSAGASRSLEFCQAAADAGTVVIDNSSAFRMDDGVPLVVPEVNPDAAFDHKGIIANPNCTTIQMLVALKPIHDYSKIKRVIVSTYQSVSGSGASAIVELENQTKAWVAGQTIEKNVYPVQIAFNVIPHVDVFMDNGYTKEEMKMVNETRKIMSAPDITVSATCVRVPVFRAHSEAINIETEQEVSVDKAYELWEKAPGVTIKDNREPAGYPVPHEVSETFDTYIGRVRKDISCKNGLAFWVVADQLFKGAALNAIQIGELLLTRENGIRGSR